MRPGSTARHRKWLFMAGVMLGACILGVLLIALGSDEPRYQGKRLSVWIDDLFALGPFESWDTETDPARAIRGLGTNALPWLLDEMRADRSPTRDALNRTLYKLRFVRSRVLDASARRRRAGIAFRALGELGEPAIPELLSLVEPGRIETVRALAAIGPPAVPALQQCLTNYTVYGWDQEQPSVPVPGATIAAIHMAADGGRFSRGDLEVLLPAVEAWATQSTNALTQRNALQLLVLCERLE